MKKYIQLLKNIRLFSGIDESEITAMLSCLQAEAFTYKKGEYVLRQGEHVENIMVLAEGKLYIQCDDYWGNRSIINMVGVGEMFGEAYAAQESAVFTNDILAVEDSVVIHFNAGKVMTVCSQTCKFHSLVVRNLFLTISEKNRKLMCKLGHMSGRTTREKLISYLSEESRRQGSADFSIPFNRQQLADFLCVDRSAMSNELCKMRNDGMIEFEKNKFRLL